MSIEELKKLLEMFICNEMIGTSTCVVVEKQEGIGKELFPYLNIRIFHSLPIDELSDPANEKFRKELLEEQVEMK